MATLEHTLTGGQSLAVGSQGTPSLSTSSEAPNAFLVASDGTTAVALKNSSTQQPQLSMGYRLAAARPGQKMGFSTHGQGGQAIAALSKGGSTGRYEQSIAYAQAARNVEVAAGGSSHVESLVWIQGEADQTFGTTAETYLAALYKLASDYTTDVGAITGQTSLPMFCTQTATWAHYNTAPRIGLAQLKAAREHAGIYLVGGQYHLPYVDGLHLTNVGYYHLGELIARAIEAVRTGAGWAPFAPIAYTMAADHIDVQYHVPTGALEFDTVTVPAITNRGFSLQGTAATITGVTLAGADTVRLSLSQPVTEPGASVGYGVAYDNGSVGQGNLCDGQSATSVYDGTRLANWAAHSLDALPIAPAPALAYRTLRTYYVGTDGNRYPTKPPRLV